MTPERSVDTSAETSVETSAKEEILGRIRTALGTASAASEPDAVPRAYRSAGTHPPGHPALLDLLVDRLVDYRATVHRCSPADVGETVAAAARQWPGGAVVVPPELPDDVLAGLRGVDVRIDASTPLSVTDLDAVDAVVTGCAVAIAVTGTLVLDASPDQGRRAISLVPDRHLVVVRAEQVVESVPEGLARLDPRRPLTMVSGPSATSDIELNRVEGVHGPRTLVVVLVEPS